MPAFKGHGPWAALVLAAALGGALVVFAVWSTVALAGDPWQKARVWVAIASAVAGILVALSAMPRRGSHSW